MKATIIMFLICLAGTWGIAQSDCRVKKEDFQPIIADLNPFFTDHQWDAYRGLEKARLDIHRSVMITQYGCKRHHIGILMNIRPEAVENTEAFFIREALSLMYMVYFGSEHYPNLRSDFEERFIQGFKTAGTGREFNFPIGGHTFICSVRNDPGRGARIRLEQATYVFAENIQRKKDLTPRSEDDGWFKANKD